MYVASYLPQTIEVTFEGSKYAPYLNFPSISTNQNIKTN